MAEQMDRELDKIEIKFKHLKQKEIEFIISKYNQGYSIREIAKLLNKKSSSIYYWLKKKGIKRRTVSQALKGNIPSNKNIEIISICPVCKNEFIYSLHSKNKLEFKKYCSRECLKIGMRGRHINPQTEFKQDDEETIEKISKSPYWKTGEENPLWLGDTKEPYSSNWKLVRREILIRDSYKCRLCGEISNSVHHIDYNKKNNKQENLIVLCRSCHCKTNFRREKWEQEMKSMIIY